MGTPSSLLRKQVASELRKRKLIAFTVVLLICIYLLISFVFGDMGLLSYKKLNVTKNDIETEIIRLEKENTQIKAQIELLKQDPFYREKYAREEFGLAKPDEYIFQYDR